MDNPERVYDLLLDYANSPEIVENVTIGVVWTLCQAQGKMGLAMSPQIATRTLPWSGTLVGKPLTELTCWIRSWDAYQATIGMAAINAAINTQSLPVGITLDAGNLAVFEHFLPQLQGKKVVVIGRYPYMERYAEQFDLQIIERQPQGSDYPDPACEFLLPQADWVFLTATSLVNKTFPRLAELAQHAKTVLMGPTTPWLPQLADFGIDYLAGVEIIHPEKLSQTIAEGGGVRIFDTAVRYRVVELARCL
jgi:hypothetical protein